MFRHLPPPLRYPTSHSPTRARNPVGAGLRRRLGATARRAKGLRVAALRAQQEEQAKYRPARAATRASDLLPIAIETFRCLGPARRASSRPFCDFESARLSHIERRRLRRCAGRALRHTAPRGKFAASARPARSPRRRFGSRKRRDMSSEPTVGGPAAAFETET